MLYKWSIPVINNIQVQQVAEVYSPNPACNIVTSAVLDTSCGDGVFGRHRMLVMAGTLSKGSVLAEKLKSLAETAAARLT
jgi:hypothetical protein